jgi:hypothetical protein
VVRPSDRSQRRALELNLIALPISPNRWRHARVVAFTAAANLAHDPLATPSLPGRLACWGGASSCADHDCRPASPVGHAMDGSRLAAESRLASGARALSMIQLFGGRSRSPTKTSNAIKPIAHPP